MHRLATVLTATAAVGFAFSASAADLPVYKAPHYVAAPQYNWTGCYVGGNVGWAFGRGEINGTGGGISATNSAFAGGFQGGCDYQFAGGFVIGARGMFDWTKLKGSGTFPAGITGITAGSIGNTQTTWFSTLTARLGYAIMPTGLIYVQGGGAWSRSDADIQLAGVQVAQFSNNKGGYDIGGGYEHMFNRNLSGFIEYNYMNFGTASATTPAGAALSLKKDSQNVLVGLNWRFR